MVLRLHYYDTTPPSNLSPVLLAVQPLDLKVRVEVEDDALRRLRRRDDPVTVLVRRVLQRITGGGDVAGLAGIVDASTLRHCDGDRAGERWRLLIVESKHTQRQEWSICSTKHSHHASLHLLFTVKPYNSGKRYTPYSRDSEDFSSFTLFLWMKM